MRQCNKNEGFVSSLKSISPEEGFNLQREKRHEYYDKDEDANFFHKI